MNSVITSAGVKEILEGKDYAVVNTVFHFIFAVLDRAVGCGDNQALTNVVTLYIEIVYQLPYTNPEREKPHIWGGVTSENIRRLKILANNLFEEFEDFNLDHITENLSRFGSLTILDASPYEYFNYFLIAVIEMTSMRCGTTLE